MYTRKLLKDFRPSAGSQRPHEVEVRQLIRTESSSTAQQGIRIFTNRETSSCIYHPADFKRHSPRERNVNESTPLEIALTCARSPRVRYWAPQTRQKAHDTTSSSAALSSPLRPLSPSLPSYLSPLLVRSAAPRSRRRPHRAPQGRALAALWAMPSPGQPRRILALTEETARRGSAGQRRPPPGVDRSVPARIRVAGLAVWQYGPSPRRRSPPSPRSLGSESLVCPGQCGFIPVAGSPVRTDAGFESCAEGGVGLGMRAHAPLTAALPSVIAPAPARD